MGSEEILVEAISSDEEVENGILKPGVSQSPCVV
jgi:hypothetical protein